MTDAGPWILWVDGVGGYLVCPAAAVSLGQGFGDPPADVPLLADVARNHAVVRRDGERYWLEAAKPCRVNQKPATQTPLTYAPPPALAPTVDPGPNGWAPYEPPSSPPGFFFDVETVLLLPVLRDRITNDTGLTPSGNQLHVPSVSLDLTVSPEIEFGYRLPDSAGYFAGSLPAPVGP